MVEVPKKAQCMCNFSYCTAICLLLIISLVFTLVYLGLMMCTGDGHLREVHNNDEQRMTPFQGRFSIPIDGDKRLNNASSGVEVNEDFDISVEEERTNIEVPEFNNDSRVRFVHDFILNLTGIVDDEKGRCFVMPLNRSAVLAPRSELATAIRTKEGYYDVELKLIKQNMIVVLPPISDYNEVGTYISIECIGKPIYRLAKHTSRVHSMLKRSAIDRDMIEFVELAGNTLRQFNIMNTDELDEYEAGLMAKNN